MKTKQSALSLACLACVSLQGLACQEEPAPPEVVAYAGEDQLVSKRQLVQLNATGSRNNNNEVLALAWYQIAGSPVLLEHHTEIAPSFTTPGQAGELVFELAITDGAGHWGRDTVTITVQDRPTEVSLPERHQLSIGSSLRVEAQIDNPDQDPLQISWSSSQERPEELRPDPEQPGVVWFTPSNTEPTQLSVVVDDGTQVITRYTQVDILNAPPEISLSPPQPRVPRGSDLVLDASQSRDPEGQALSFHWEALSGAIPNRWEERAQGQQLILGKLQDDLRVLLRLSDPQGVTVEQEIYIDVLQAPLHIEASPVQRAYSTDTVTLRAWQPGQEQDVRWTWTQLSGVPVQLSSPQSAQTTFTAPLARGPLEFQVTVENSDASVAAATARVQVVGPRDYDGASGPPPENPMLPSKRLRYPAQDIAVLPHHLYFAHGGDGLTSYSLADPQDPRLDHQITDIHPTLLATRGELLVVASDDELRLYRVSADSDPQMLWTAPLSSPPRTLAINDEYIALDTTRATALFSHEGPEILGWSGGCNQGRRFWLGEGPGGWLSCEPANTIERVTWSQGSASHGDPIPWPEGRRPLAMYEQDGDSFLVHGQGSLHRYLSNNPQRAWQRHVPTGITATARWGEWLYLLGGRRLSRLHLDDSTSPGPIEQLAVHQEGLVAATEEAAYLVTEEEIYIFPHDLRPSAELQQLALPRPVVASDRLASDRNYTLLHAGLEMTLYQMDNPDQWQATRGTTQRLPSQRLDLWMEDEASFWLDSYSDGTHKIWNLQEDPVRVVGPESFALPDLIAMARTRNLNRLDLAADGLHLYDQLPRIDVSWDTSSELDHYPLELRTDQRALWQVDRTDDTALLLVHQEAHLRRFQITPHQTLASVSHLPYLMAPQEVLGMHLHNRRLVLWSAHQIEIMDLDAPEASVLWTPYPDQPDSRILSVRHDGDRLYLLLEYSQLDIWEFGPQRSLLWLASVPHASRRSDLHTWNGSVVWFSSDLHLHRYTPRPPLEFGDEEIVAHVGQVLSYELPEDLPPQEALACYVTEGSCALNRRSLTWRLPNTPGDAELLLLYGDASHLQHIGRKRVRVVR